MKICMITCDYSECKKTIHPGSRVMVTVEHVGIDFPIISHYCGDSCLYKYLRAVYEEKVKE